MTHAEGHHWNIGLFVTICVKYFSLLCLVSLYQWALSVSTFSSILVTYSNLKTSFQFHRLLFEAFRRQIQMSIKKNKTTKKLEWQCFILKVTTMKAGVTGEMKQVKSALMVIKYFIKWGRVGAGCCFSTVKNSCMNAFTAMGCLVSSSPNLYPAHKRF